MQMCSTYKYCTACHGAAHLVHHINITHLLCNLYTYSPLPASLSYTHPPSRPEGRPGTMLTIHMLPCQTHPAGPLYASLHGVHQHRVRAAFPLQSPVNCTASSETTPLLTHIAPQIVVLPSGCRPRASRLIVAAPAGDLPAHGRANLTGRPVIHAPQPAHARNGGCNSCSGHTAINWCPRGLIMTRLKPTSPAGPLQRDMSTW